MIKYVSVLFLMLFGCVAYGQQPQQDSEPTIFPPKIEAEPMTPPATTTPPAVEKEEPKAVSPTIAKMPAVEPSPTLQKASTVTGKVEPEVISVPVAPKVNAVPPPTTNPE